MRAEAVCDSGSPDGGSKPWPAVAMIVDGPGADGRLLEQILIAEGFAVIRSADTGEAIRRFQEIEIDIVFLDGSSSGNEAVQAAWHIKEFASERFVPVVFLTDEADEGPSLSCIESGGGDDLLRRPYSRELLRAKLKALGRMGRINREHHQQLRELRALHRELQQEQELAERIYSHAITAENVPLSHVHTWFQPTATFSGDLLVTARRPSGELSLLLGDFTGHGLKAAIGALPVSQTFRSMTAKGYTPDEILFEMNGKLASLLPAGMFMCACMVLLDRQRGTVSVWNCGMPPALILRPGQGVVSRIESAHVPLGITQIRKQDLRPEIVSVGGEDRFVAYSDGLIEAKVSENRRFGQVHLENILTASRGGAEGVEAVKSAINAMCGPSGAEDDITFVDIDCGSDTDHGSRSDDLVDEHGAGTRHAAWTWSILLESENLKHTDPVPLAMSQISELVALGRRRDRVFTILSELYHGVLEQGVLRLKDTPAPGAEALARFQFERQRRLSELHGVRVRLQVRFTSDADGLRFEFEVTLERDSTGSSGPADTNHDDYKEDRSWVLPRLRGLPGRLEVRSEALRLSVIDHW